MFGIMQMKAVHDLDIAGALIEKHRSDRGFKLMRKARWRYEHHHYGDKPSFH